MNLTFISQYEHDLMINGHQRYLLLHCSILTHTLTGVTMRNVNALTPSLDTDKNSVIQMEV